MIRNHDLPRWVIQEPPCLWHTIVIFPLHGFTNCTLCCWFGRVAAYCMCSCYNIVRKVWIFFEKKIMLHVSITVKNCQNLTVLFLSAISLFYLSGFFCTAFIIFPLVLNFFVCWGKVLKKAIAKKSFCHQ